jgi:hypothetical protein
MFFYFSSCLSKPECFVGSGTACGKNCCPCHIGVPAKKASAIKMPKGFLLLTAPGFEECVGSLIFMGFFLSGLRRVVKPKSCKSFYFICSQCLPELKSVRVLFIGNLAGQCGKRAATNPGHELTEFALLVVPV